MDHIAKAHTKHVHFTPLVEVNTFDRLDPALKADLYYSRKELHFIRKRFRLAVALRQQLIKSKELQEQFNDSKAYIEYLQQKAKTNERKRRQSNSTMQSMRKQPVQGTKRRRIQ